MNEINNNEEYEEAISSYYEGRGVSSMISFKVDTKKADGIAEKLTTFDNIEDVFLLTGDIDIIVKARFKDYDHMKSFLVDEASNLDGVMDLNSMMIVTSYKERGEIIFSEKGE
ncbi:MAG: Lrp/AsnC family transcriptional regulator [Thermoplasmatota archaeon]